MTLLKFDNYEIKKDKLKDADSNYNVSISIFKDKSLIGGWHEKDTTPNKHTLERALKFINREPEKLF